MSRSWQSMGVLKHDSEPAPRAAERRRDKRVPWVANVRLTSVGPSSEERELGTIEVTTQEISQGGFSFLCGQFLFPGTVVAACFESLPGGPVLAGVVRNCTSRGDAIYRVGVQFTGRWGGKRKIGGNS